MLEGILGIFKSIVSVFGYIFACLVGFYLANKTHEKFDHWLLTVSVFIGVVVLWIMVFISIFD